MCRMIMAQGDFNAVDVVEAARAMSCGETARHNGAVRQHSDGWGCVWMDNGRLYALRGSGSLANAIPLINIPTSTRFLAIHVRHSTLKENAGIKFSHPLLFQSHGTRWYMMHNGYLPNIYIHLGLESSIFDSAEYLKYIVSGLTPDKMCLAYLDERMKGVAPGGSARNFFLITEKKFWVWQWYPMNTPCIEYFTMRLYNDKNVKYISSEIVPSLAMESQWRSLHNNELLEFCMTED